MCAICRLHNTCAQSRTMRWFLYMHVGVKDCALQLHNLEIAQMYCAISRSRKSIAQSRDRATIAHNLGILRMRNATSRLRKFSDCTEHIHTYTVCSYTSNVYSNITSSHTHQQVSSTMPLLQGTGILVH